MRGGDGGSRDICDLSILSPFTFNWNAWSLRLWSSLGSVTDEEFKNEASRLAVTFWGRIGEFLMRSRTGSELSPDEKALWIQSGLAVSPLMGTCLQCSLDFCQAWALIGEWTSRVLFPVSQGLWPRHGHAGALLQNYQCRTPRIVAGARAAYQPFCMPMLEPRPVWKDLLHRLLPKDGFLWLLLSGHRE